MDADIALVLGLVIAILTIPSVLSAFLDDRPPRASAITILIAGALILYAIMTRPGGIPIAQVPDIVMTVIARFLR